MRAAKTIVALAVLGLASVGCGAAPEDGGSPGYVDENTQYDENGDPIEQVKEIDLSGTMAMNGLTRLNGLTTTNGLLGSNGLLSTNGLVNANGMTYVNGLYAVNGMTNVNGLYAVNGLLRSNGLTGSSQQYEVIPHGGDMMKTADGRNLVSYIVKCALRSDQSITRKDQYGTSYTFTGSVGLADYWLSNNTAACDQACEEWVSACLMAHYNPSGRHINIMMVASHPRIGWGNPDKNLYDEEEAGWYGNFFSNPPRAQYCDWLGGGDRDGCVDNSSCPIKRADDYCNDDDGRTRMTMTGVKYYDTALLNSTNCKDGICVGTYLSGTTCNGYPCAWEYTRVIKTVLTEGY